MAPPMTDPESALYSSQDPSFEMGRSDTHDDVQILAWEVGINNESKPWSSKVAAAENEEALVKQESRQMEPRWTTEEDVISQDENSVGKDLVANKMATMVEDALNVFLSKMLHNAQSEVWSAVYNVFEEVMQNLLRK